MSQPKLEMNFFWGEVQASDFDIDQAKTYALEAVTLAVLARVGPPGDESLSERRRAILNASHEVSNALVNLVFNAPEPRGWPEVKEEVQ